MSTAREQPGVADVVAVVIGPALITVMITSLAFFLIEVFYGGEYSGRMRWSMFFYILGCVLVARIAIEWGDGRASLYGLILGLVMFLAMQRFVEFPPGWMQVVAPLINIGLLTLTWWLAQQLTWDCTHIDPQRDASDRGLLQATGLESVESLDQRLPTDAETVEATASHDVNGEGLFTRFRQWREQQRKKPHTPGVWVVYFALAALPIFGLGQALIPVEDRGGRAFSFAMMVLYVGSAMGLLLTTAFLGLRRYLEQRHLHIPARVARIWLGIGSALIVLFLIVAALLPRPASETALIDISWIVGSPDRSASRYATLADGRGKGPGAAGQASSPDASTDGSATGKSPETGRGPGTKDARQGQGDDKGRGGDSGQSDQAGDQIRGDRPNDQAVAQKSRSQASLPRDDRATESRSNTEGQRTSSSDRGSKVAPRSPSSFKGPITLGLAGRLFSIVKWLVFAVLVSAFVLFLVYRGLKLMSQFSEWAKGLLKLWDDLWEKLFGRTTPAAADRSDDETDEPRGATPKFADFRNPFDSGEAGRWSPGELVRHGFAALEAWAEEAGTGREAHETPLEFAQRFGERHGELRVPATRLATLYARLAYSRRPLPKSSREVVADFWRQLEVVGRPAATANATRPTAED